MTAAELRKPRDDEFAPGLVLESRDRQYEPGRQIRLIEHNHATGSYRRWVAQTIANPARPGRVGTRAQIRQPTLRAKWGIPTDPP